MKSMEIIKDRLMIQYVRDGVLYATEDHYVFRSADEGKTWETICCLEVRRKDAISRAKDMLLRTEPARRMRRNIGIHNLVVLPSGTVIIQYDGIYRYDGTGKRARRVFDFSAHGIIGPLKNGLAVDDETGNVYFGEYAIDRPYAVRIVKGGDDGRNWEICHQFPKGRVRHVHSIVPDDYRQRLWICAGDNDRETGLFYTDNQFDTVHLFQGGDQRWRMVSLIPLNEGLVWGSDAGQDAPADAKNHIYYWDFQKQTAERVACIDKPAYFTARLGSGAWVMSITHEPKIHRPVKPSTELWGSVDGAAWRPLVELPYLPAGRSSGTRYGMMCLPQGDGSAADVFTTPLNVEEYDFALLKMNPDIWGRDSK